MAKVLVFTSALLAVAPLSFAFAQDATTLPVQHAGCENSLVCATMRDGRSVAITDCKARRDGAVHYLYGDCHDED